MKTIRSIKVISNYQEVFRNQCRSLWLEHVAWHREMYRVPTIGGGQPNFNLTSIIQNSGIFISFASCRKPGISRFFHKLRILDAGKTQLFVDFVDKHWTPGLKLDGFNYEQ